MVLGSCGPEFVMNLIEAVQVVSLKDYSTYNPSKFNIGFSTIIGSAAFRTIFITAISILAPSKDKDVVRLY